MIFFNLVEVELKLEQFDPLIMTPDASDSCQTKSLGSPAEDEFLNHA